MKPFALKYVMSNMISPFDLTYLEDAFQGNRRLVNGIIELFLKDIKDFLREEIALIEKEFRAAVKETDWAAFEGKYVGVLQKQ